MCLSVYVSACLPTAISVYTYTYTHIYIVRVFCVTLYIYVACVHPPIWLTFSGCSSAMQHDRFVLHVFDAVGRESKSAI